MEKGMTSYGLEFYLLDAFDPKWDELHPTIGNYYKTVAKTHLLNYGKIIVDATDGAPVDNEYDLEEISAMIVEM